MIGAVALAVLLSALPAGAQEESQETVVSEDITIRGKKLPGPAVAAPPVRPEKPLIDEVIRSLSIYKREHKTNTPKMLVKGQPKQFARLYPEPPFLVFSPATFKYPYQRWRFEVFTTNETVWTTEGTGKLTDKLEWDGTNGAGRYSARVGMPYSFRFTGIQEGTDEMTVASQPLEMTSMYYREDLGGMRMEVANAVVFEAGTAAFRESGFPYLQEMANRLRQFRPGRKPYKLFLYHKSPESRLALDRAQAIREYLGKELLINPNKIGMELFGILDRGDVIACEMPPEVNRSMVPKER
ncbi:MAG: hypothetical protein HY078_06265 [Elusimicrobia bacterium]|nr:hypothetical protein [Elusimicrobiota bacterium]